MIQTGSRWVWGGWAGDSGAVKGGDRRRSGVLDGGFGPCRGVEEGEERGERGEMRGRVMRRGEWDGGRARRISVGRGTGCGTQALRRSGAPGTVVAGEGLIEGIEVGSGWLRTL